MLSAPTLVQMEVPLYYIILLTDHQRALFPDYQLPDHDGKKRKLSGLQGQDPVALMLARGGYCPKEHLQHKWLADMQTAIKVGYCRLITISTDTILESKEWRTRLEACWPFLSDEERVVQQELDIKEYTDPQHNPRIPYTILLEPGLKIYKIPTATGTGGVLLRKK
jgi:peroxiredoxin